jgi:hypothetical protein
MYSKPTIMRRMLNMRGCQVSRRVAKSSMDDPPKEPAICLIAYGTG